MLVHLIDGTFELFRYFLSPPAAFDRSAPGELRAVRGGVASILGMLEGGVTHLGVATDRVIESFRDVILAADEPKLAPMSPATPDRWAEERQYLRNDAGEALAAFRKRRQESLDFLGKLAPEQWKRGGIHATRGHISVEDFVTLMAWHDDNHLDQLRRALESIGGTKALLT